MSETQIQTCSKANKRKVKITPIFKSPEIISLAFWYLLLHSLHTYMCVFFDKQRWDLCVCLVAQSCPTLCNPMDCGPPGSSSAHGILQGRIQSGYLFPSPGDLSDSGIKPRSPTLQADSFTI